MKHFALILILATLAACQPQQPSEPVGRYQFIHPTGGTSVIMGDTATGALYIYVVNQASSNEWHLLAYLPPNGIPVFEPAR